MLLPPGHNSTAAGSRGRIVVTLMDTAKLTISERKRRILRLLVKHYIQRVKPISSGYLAKLMSLSSATIRNELKDLTELGYLEQPHPASGRIPTFRAYRLYVDELMSKLVVDADEVQHLVKAFRQLERELELLLSSSLERLMRESPYLAYVTVPEHPPLIIRSLNLLEVDRHQLVIVLVTDLGVTQSGIIQTDVPVHKLRLGLLSERLTNYLRGRRIRQVRMRELRRILSDFTRVPVGLVDRLEQVLARLREPEERVIFTEAYRLLTHPEFGEGERFRHLVDSISDRERFLSTIEQRVGDRPLAAIIGDEAGCEEFADLSILASNYELDESARGQLGVVGPTRLEYRKTMPLVLNVAQALSQVLKEWRSRGEG